VGDVDAAVREAWAAAGGDPAELAAVRCTGPAHALPSAFRVTDVAAASIAAAALAGAGLWADRNGEALPEVAVDRRHAAIACRSERHVAAEAPLDWPDPVTGDHRTVDGWARVHAVYPHHRAAALAVLGAGEDRSEVAAAVARWEAERLEAAVVAAGGVAAALRPAAAWAAHPHGSTVRALPLLAVERTGGGPPRPLPPAERPLAGVRVLDLTRVIAGPTATKWLAALGADVLRVEPPGYREVPVLAVDTGFGKRATALDLRAPGDRAAFDRLVAGADVLVAGLRPGALDGLGYGPARVAALAPGLVTARLSAWGGTGPWRDRRGFDSLVQTASGIADAGRAAAGADHPVPLPCQLLDHATAYLLALGACAALRRRAGEGGSWAVTASLARTGAWLADLGPADALGAAEPTAAEVAAVTATAATAWGATTHVRPAASIAGVPVRWDRPPPAGAASPPAW
jgi:hypothetical protein